MKKGIKIVANTQYGIFNPKKYDEHMKLILKDSPFKENRELYSNDTNKKTALSSGVLSPQSIDK